MASTNLLVHTKPVEFWGESGPLLFEFLRPCFGVCGGESSGTGRGQMSSNSSDQSRGPREVSTSELSGLRKNLELFTMSLRRFLSDFSAFAKALLGRSVDIRGRVFSGGASFRNPNFVVAVSLVLADVLLLDRSLTSAGTRPWSSVTAR